MFYIRIAPEANNQTQTSTRHIAIRHRPVSQQINHSPSISTIQLSHQEPHTSTVNLANEFCKQSLPSALLRAMSILCIGWHHYDESGSSSLMAKSTTGRSCF